MLIDLNALGPASFDISPRLMSIIDLLKSAPDSASFVWRISKILERSPYLGKSEMVRWAEILNRCDEILATAVSYAQSSSSVMLVDVNADLASQVLKIIAFTTLLFESTYSRSIYSSVDHIMQLLDVSNMEVVVKTLNLIHVMSKRSRFISQHLSHDQRKKLVTRIVAIAQPWGGKDHNVRMEEVVNHLIDPTSLFVPVSFPDVNDVIGMISDVGMNHLVAEKMDEITSNWTIGTAEKWVLNVKLRAIHSFRTVEGTMLSVMARLIATSILVYIRNLCDEWLLNVVVYDGFTEEVAHLLHAEASLNDSYMDMIKTEALKTLNSIMALDGPSRKVISVMVEYLEANSYHGFLAQSTRKCVDDLCQGQMQSLGHTSVNFCTALFSLLYHLAGSDSGGDALLSCSLIDTLLNVISCENIKSDFISFVTRSVRVIDVLTTVDASSFTLLTGMNIIISRLVFEIKQQITDDVNRCLNEQCYQERAALIKSMLNFLKRAVQDSQFGDYIRSIMDGELPGALIQIIERSEFFGVSLFNNAICLISTFIYHNPAELTSLQEKGVTTAILRSLFRSELAPSRETITNLPSTFSALCLNENGVREFLAEEPFEHFCNIFVSAKYLPALGRRKNEISETTVTLGSSIDDFVRQHPQLRPNLLSAFVSMMNKVIEMGTKNNPVCVMSLPSKSHSASRDNNVVSQDAAASSNMDISGSQSNTTNDNETSEDEDDDDDGGQSTKIDEGVKHSSSCSRLGPSPSVIIDGKPIIPLGDYMINIIKFLETFLTQNVAADQVQGFVKKCGAGCLIDMLCLKPICLEVFESVLPHDVSIILKLLFQQTQDDQIIELIMKSISREYDRLSSELKECEDNGDATAATLLTNASSSNISQALCTIAMLGGVLSKLSEMAVGSNSDLRNVTLRWWTSQRLLSDICAIHRVLLWEVSAINVHNMINKASSTVQTDESFLNGNITGPALTVECPIGFEPASPKTTERESLPAGSWLRSTTGQYHVKKCLRQIHNLLFILIQMSANTTGRGRRFPESSTYAPCSLSVTLATKIFSHFRDLLMQSKSVKHDQRCWLRFLNECLIQLYSLLFEAQAFEERSSPIHLSLSAFYHTGCHLEFFKLIEANVTRKVRKDYPMEADQLILVWLNIVERLVNANALRHTRYRLAPQCPESERFPVDKFLAVCLRDAFFHAKMLLERLQKSNEPPNGKICERILVIFREIARSVIPVRTFVSSRPTETVEDRQRMLAESDVTRLTEMGFNRPDAMNALLRYRTVNEAAEYLINISSGGIGQTRISNAYSLRRGNGRGSQRGGSEAQTTRSGDSQSRRRIDEIRNDDFNAFQRAYQDAQPCPLSRVKGLNTRRVTKVICNEILPFAYEHLRRNEDLVHYASSLYLAVADEAKNDWRQEKFIGRLLSDEVLNDLDHLEKNLGDAETAARLSSRLLFYCLVWSDGIREFDEKNGENCEKIRALIVKVLSYLCTCSDFQGACMTVMGPMLLWLFFYAKFVDAKTSKKVMEEAVSNLVWKCWDTPVDVVHGTTPSPTWVSYPAATSGYLSRALCEGRSAANLTVSGVNYCVDFANMVIRNVESQTEKMICVNARLKSGITLNNLLTSESSAEWKSDILTTMVPLLIKSMACPNLDGHVCGAVLLICARITMDFEVADRFVQGGGVENLIHLSGRPLPNNSTLVHLIVRHCFEDESSLTDVFEGIVRNVVIPTETRMEMNEWNRSNRVSRDWDQAIRALSYICIRNPQAYVATMKRVARKQGDSMVTVPASKEAVSTVSSSARADYIMRLLVERVLDDSWADEKFILTRASLTRLIAELCKSYGCAVRALIEMKCDNGESALFNILDRFLANSSGSTSEMPQAVRCVISTLATNKHTQKAQETLVNAIVLCLERSLNKPYSCELVFQIRALAHAVLMSRDLCASRDSRSSGDVLELNPLMFHLLNKRILVHLTKSTWALKLASKEDIETANHLLRTIEELARFIYTVLPQGASVPSESRGSRSDAPTVLPTSVSAHNYFFEVQTQGGTQSTQDQSDEQQNNEDRGEMEIDSSVIGPEVVSAANADELHSNDSEDEDGDDEGDGHDENDMDLDESDEEDDDVNDQGMDEADEENEYGIEMVDETEGPSDGADNDESGFMNANLFVLSPDNVGILGSSTQSGFPLTVDNGYEIPRNDRNTGVSVHPLLDPPSSTSAIEPSVQRPSQNYSDRVRHTLRRLGANATGWGLQRRGAVRRVWGTQGGSDQIDPFLGGPSAERLPQFEIFPARYHIIVPPDMPTEAIDTGYGTSSDERRQFGIPSPLERYHEEVMMVNGASLFYSTVVFNAYISQYLDELNKREKSEKEKLEKDKKIKSEEQQNSTELDVEIIEATTISIPPRSNLQPVLQEAHENADVDSGSRETPTAHLPFSDCAANMNQHNSSSDEPMDTSTTLVEGTASSSSTDTPEEHTEESGRESMRHSGGTAASVPGASAVAHTSEATVAERTSPAACVAVDTVDAATEAALGTSNVPIPSDLRSILGDIEIPEGVDPAFLAALPEDMRQEVIRDHTRQQRARRLAEATNAQASNEAATDTSTSMLAHIDQDFLSALPPELQEEILNHHERTLRLASQRDENRNNGQSGANGVESSGPDIDGAAAFFESLPSPLRSQILVELDDSVLQVLPASVVSEARRVRANIERQMLGESRFRSLVRRVGYQLPVLGSRQIGPSSISLSFATKSARQLMDLESILTLVILFFVDPARLCTQRLQKLFKDLCHNALTCDTVIWCLMSLLDRFAHDVSPLANYGGLAVGWVERICVPIGIGQVERVFDFSEFPHFGTPKIHPTVAVNVIRLILETLNMLAKSFSGHFLPFELRPPELRYPVAVRHSGCIWTYIFRLNEKLPTSQDVPYESGTNICSNLPLGWVKSMDINNCVLADLTLMFKHKIIRSSAMLQDKLMKLIWTIVQAMPNDMMERITYDSQGVIPLWRSLETVAEAMAYGKLSDDGLVDGKNVLFRTMRILPSAAGQHVFSVMYRAARLYGFKLLGDIIALEEELKTMSVCQQKITGDSCDQPSTSQHAISDRYDGSTVIIEGDSNSRAVVNASGCKELQLPSIRVLTNKNSSQYSFLQCLQTISRIRDVLREQDKKHDEDRKRVGQQRHQTEAELEQEAASSEEQPKNQEPYSSSPNSRLNEILGEKTSERLKILSPLFNKVSSCLERLSNADPHAALALQPSAEAFFLVYGSSVTGLDPSKYAEDPDTVRLMRFSEKHRWILNQILRQSGNLFSGPFAVLTQMPKLLDFDVKRKFFRKRIQQLDEGIRPDDVAFRVRRDLLFSESFRELCRLRGPEWKARFYVTFVGEEGQDAGGLLREWFSIITREIFNPNYGLFITAPGDRATYMINKASYVNPEHLEYFKFVGHIIAKAIYENKLLDCFFTRAFYKHILSLPVCAQDLESEDPSYYKSLVFLLENPIEQLGTELSFSVEVEEFGVTKIRELKENGAKISVTDANKAEYVKLVCQMKMTGSINQQLKAFLDGFYEIIPRNLISMFNEQELELLICGLPNIDIDDLYANTEYKTYTKNSLQIIWFWKALRSFEQEDRAKFLQFVTGTSKVPLQGFGSLEGMNGSQKFSIHMDSRSSTRLPSAHTCFNQLDLPQYETYDQLRRCLLLAVRECTEGYGFA